MGDDDAGGRVADKTAYAAREILGECEGLLAAHGALDRCVAMQPRDCETQKADLRIRFGEREWLRSDAGQELVASLLSHSGYRPGIPWARQSWRV